MYPALDEDCLDDDVIIVEAKKIFNNVLVGFSFYFEEARKRFFNFIWVLHPSEKMVSKGVMSWRAKHAMFRYFVSKELTDTKVFPSYPNVFRSWMEMSRDDDDGLKYDAFCMFPIEVANTLWEICEWEFRNCPWYLECNH